MVRCVEDSAIDTSVSGPTHPFEDLLLTYQSAVIAPTNVTCIEHHTIFSLTGPCRFNRQAALTKGSAISSGQIDRHRVGVLNVYKVVVELSNHSAVRRRRKKKRYVVVERCFVVGVACSRYRLTMRKRDVSTETAIVGTTNRYKDGLEMWWIAVTSGGIESPRDVYASGRRNRRAAVEGFILT